MHAIAHCASIRNLPIIVYIAVYMTLASPMYYATSHTPPRYDAQTRYSILVKIVPKPLAMCTTHLSLQCNAPDLAYPLVMHSSLRTAIYLCT